jgi:Tfp pilus assembly protein PilO
MKKVWALLAVGTLATVIVGCMIRASDAEIQQINNLAELLAKSAELSQQFERKEITAEQLKQLTLELEDKYTQLTENDLPPNKEINQLEKNINEKLAGIKQTISTTDLILPGRALAL